MNIFAVSDNPGECAQALDDRRVVKMVLETAQLLSAAARTRPELVPTGVDPDRLYRLSHLNHPVSLWVRQCPAHYQWTRRLLEALLEEYGLRYGRVHACRGIAEALGDAEESEPPSSWCNCTPYPQLPTFDAYRATLDAKWLSDGRPPTWRHRGPPAWSRVAGDMAKDPG
jgi:hypothetical protein